MATTTAPRAVRPRSKQAMALVSTAVSREDEVALHEAARDGEKPSNKDGASQHRREHADAAWSLRGPQQAVAADQEADEQSPGIAEEHGGSAEGVAQETEQAAKRAESRFRARPRPSSVPTSSLAAKKSGGGDQADSRGLESIESVDEIEGIGRDEEPAHGEDQAQEEGTGDAKSTPERDRGGEDLAQQLEARRELKKSSRMPVAKMTAAPGRSFQASGVGEQADESDDEGGGDGDAAEARDQVGVNFAETGAVDDIVGAKNVADDGREEERDQERFREGPLRVAEGTMPTRGPWRAGYARVLTAFPQRLGDAPRFLDLGQGRRS